VRERERLRAGRNGKREREAQTQAENVGECVGGLVAGRE